MNRVVRVAGVLFVFCLTVLAGEHYACRFHEKSWNPDDWIVVKSPRWDRLGAWIQEEDCIRNETPDDATPREMISKRAGETYSSMVLKKRFSGNVIVRATMMFMDRMAPLVVLAPELGTDARERPEYREHFEIVLYDKGINVWHHTWAEGKPSWKKAAYWQFDLAAEEKHGLEVQVRRTAKGKRLVLKLGEREMGCLLDALPDAFHVGITGCEGVNRFYEFSVQSE